jgi:hypothetical protein
MPSQKKVARALKGRIRDPPIRQQDDEHEVPLIFVESPYRESSLL